jgi:hypothetical protein
MTYGNENKNISNVILNSKNKKITLDHPCNFDSYVKHIKSGIQHRQLVNPYSLLSPTVKKGIWTFVLGGLTARLHHHLKQEKKETAKK